MIEPVIVPINYIERKPGSDKYRVLGKGVTVDFLALFIDDSQWPVARISAEYDLTPAEIHAAWAVYYDHKAEIDKRHADEMADANQLAPQDAARRKAIQDR